MRGIWVGGIYIAINYISIVSASYSPVTFKTTTNFSDIYFIFSFKICFDQIFVVEIFWGASFQQEMQLWAGCFFKVYATHFLMWPPLWYNSKLAKSIPYIVLNLYPFIQKSPFKYFIMLLLKSVVFSIIIRIHKFA